MVARLEPWPPPPKPRTFHRVYIAPGVWLVADDGVVALSLPTPFDVADTVHEERSDYPIPPALPYIPWSGPAG